MIFSLGTIKLHADAMQSTDKAKEANMMAPPAVKIGEIVKFSKVGDEVNFEGAVLKVTPEGALLIQDASGEINVAFVKKGTDLKTGDKVIIFGKVKLDDKNAKMIDASKVDKNKVCKGLWWTLVDVVDFVDKI